MGNEECGWAREKERKWPPAARQSILEQDTQVAPNKQPLPLVYDYVCEWVNVTSVVKLNSLKLENV